MPHKFSKMNGAGNDFIIFDARCQNINLSPEQIRALSSRDNKVTGGCDQLLILKPSTDADIFMQIYNADGGEVDACGNATRCIADILEEELGRLPVTIETNAAILQGVQKEITPDGQEYILVDMGKPKFEWQEVPLSMPVKEATTAVEEFSGLRNPTFISMGNPHVLFFMDGLPDDEEVAKTGSQIENFIEVFPKRVNVSFVNLQKLSQSGLYQANAKVWERGAGLTKACGTGACAIMAAANRQNSAITSLNIIFENSGESVVTHLQKDLHILLGGKVEKEFEETIEI
jgi:diaminopimelate epimerase